MKEITVELSEEQDAYLEVIAKQFPRISKGELLLALGFSGIIECGEGRVESLLEAIRGYVVERGVPDLPASRFFEFGHKCRAPGAHYSDVAPAEAVAGSAN